MYFSLGEVMAVFSFGIACLFFLSSIRVRELAVAAVQRASQQDDFQLLDQSVHVQKVSMSRDERGSWCLWRQYRFDYSYDGVERKQGHVIMLGKKMQALVVSEPDRTLH